MELEAHSSSTDEYDYAPVLATISKRESDFIREKFPADLRKKALRYIQKFPSEPSDLRSPVAKDMVGIVMPDAGVRTSGKTVLALVLGDESQGNEPRAVLRKLANIAPSMRTDFFSSLASLSPERFRAFVKNHVKPNSVNYFKNMSEAQSQETHQTIASQLIDDSDSTPEELQSIARNSRTELSQLNSIIDHSKTNADVLDAVLDNSNLNRNGDAPAEKDALQIFRKIVRHEKCTTSLMHRIVDPSKIDLAAEESSGVLFGISESSRADASLLAASIKNPNETVLQSAVNNSNADRQTLAAALDHPNCNQFTLRFIARHQHADDDLLHRVLDRQEMQNMSKEADLWMQALLPMGSQLLASDYAEQRGIGPCGRTLDAIAQRSGSGKGLLKKVLDRSETLPYDSVYEAVSKHENADAALRFRAQVGRVRLFTAEAEGRETKACMHRLSSEGWKVFGTPSNPSENMKIEGKILPSGHDDWICLGNEGGDVYVVPKKTLVEIIPNTQAQAREDACANLNELKEGDTLSISMSASGPTRFEKPQAFAYNIRGSVVLGSGNDLNNGRS